MSCVHWMLLFFTVSIEDWMRVKGTFLFLRFEVRALGDSTLGHDDALGYCTSTRTRDLDANGRLVWSPISTSTMQSYTVDCVDTKEYYMASQKIYYSVRRVAVTAISESCRMK